MPPPSEPSTSATRGPRSSAASGAGGGLVEPADPEPGLLQPVERAGEIDDADQRHPVERARGGLGERPGDRRRAMARRSPRRAAPKAAAERSTAPTLCGSLTWSSATMTQRPGGGRQLAAADRRDRARASGSTSSASPDAPRPRGSSAARRSRSSTSSGRAVAAAALGDARRRRSCCGLGLLAGERRRDGASGARDWRAPRRPCAGRRSSARRRGAAGVAGAGGRRPKAWRLWPWC